jgi:hypothetical protein
MARSEDILLTTKDNKFNPFTEEEDWRAFDTDYSHPYNTEAYYMRRLGMRNPDNFTAEELSIELLQVFEEIIMYNKEIGYDIYEMIDRDGNRFQELPEDYRGLSDPTLYYVGE